MLGCNNSPYIDCITIELIINSKIFFSDSKGIHCHVIPGLRTRMIIVLEGVQYMEFERKISFDFMVTVRQKQYKFRQPMASLELFLL